MEARAATWDEVDGNVWTVPEHRTKNGLAHSVPLSSEALSVLGLAIKHKREGSNLIFPGPKGILSDVGINKVLHAAKSAITAHGIARSSFRDWAAEEAKASDKVAEAALNHTNPNETESRYLRTKFFESRVGLMGAWGDFCAGVHPLRIAQCPNENSKAD
jgi:integrase